MCDRCEIDMLMFGEPVKHEPPVWEKGRFQAKAVDEKPQEREHEAEDQKPGRDQE